MSDPFTWETRLCDDDGMVSREVAFTATLPPALSLTYLDVHNNLRAHTHGVNDRISEPFHCTGSAHLAGEHIRCTSPAHKANRVLAASEILDGPVSVGTPKEGGDDE